MAQQTLLERIQRHVPSATQPQLDDALLAASLSSDKVASDNALMQSIVGRLKKSVPGGMTTIAPVAPPAPMLKEEAKTEEVKTIDRDWATFNIKDLPSLTTAELRSFKEFREAELERQNLLNELYGLESKKLDIESVNLKAQTQVQTADRVLESERAASEYAHTSGDELIKLARISGKTASEDQFNRDRAALERAIELGKQTPTQGEIRLAQLEELRLQRTNALVGIQNKWETQVQSMQLASADPSVVTIDA